MSTININPDPTSMRVSSPKRTVLSVLAALNVGKVSTAVDRFDDRFTFTDHALGLEFTDKRRLIEFFTKSRELFPDTLVQADAIFECGDNVIVEWTLSSTWTFSPGPLGIPISLQSASFVHVENGRVREWSHYYDQLTSRRGDLPRLLTQSTE